ncbi:MAG: DUF4435 domain-containing protein [Candidatus Methanomethylophilaceae archaeon]|nr:DUF4435 domain-containing protein [Candidatus Methanomethylophilaceae archaeon]
MREYLTPDDICNQLSMGRSVFDGVYLMVEGVTDQRLFEKFIDKDGVRIAVGHSKDNVRNVVRTMSERRGDRRTIGIVDADLDRLRRRRVSPPLFHTDCRDMETMAIRSNALDDVLDEYCDVDALGSFTGSVGPVRDAVVGSSVPIGLLMHVSQRDGLGLRFKDLDFNRFVNPRTLSIDVHTMVSDVIGNSNGRRIGRRELLQRLDDEMASLSDPWDAARGHDAVDILLIGLKRNFGSFNSRSLTEGELGGALRLAFSDHCFMGTRLYADTSEWSEREGVPLWDLVSPS